MFTQLRCPQIGVEFMQFSKRSRIMTPSLAKWDNAEIA
jgi:hypothetical protein